MWVWREREHVQDILELLTGNRCHYAMNTVGGVRRDVSESQAKKALDRLKEFEKGIKEVLDAVYDNPVLRARTEDVGVLKLPDAVDGGAVGPTARASGWKIDLEDRRQGRRPVRRLRRPELGGGRGRRQGCVGEGCGEG